MTKQKQHPHAEFLRALADGDPLDGWECSYNAWIGAWAGFAAGMVESVVANPREWQVRRKPKTIRIGDMEVPEPMRGAPKVGTRYWKAELIAPAIEVVWRCDALDKKWLALGICHATEEAAEAHRRALILASGGTP